MTLLVDGWWQAAVVVRSHCHDRTWVGHVQGATYEDTPAGPLNVVKRAVEVMVGGETRWRHSSSADEDCWTCETRG